MLLGCCVFKCVSVDGAADCIVLPTIAVLSLMDGVMFFSIVFIHLYIYVFCVFIYFVEIKGAVSSSDYVASNGRVSSAQRA